MSYSYSSYSKTTTTTTSGDISTSRTTTRTTTSDGSSVIVRELNESEVSNLPFNNAQTSNSYEILDDDRLTKYDFYSLMNSDDEEFESDTESDVEYHWFPSLMHKSVIEFLDDKEQEHYMDEDSFESNMEVEENEGDLEEDSEEDIKELHEDTGDYYSTPKEQKGHVNKQQKRHHKKSSEKPKKTEQVPIDVVYITI